MWRLSPNARSLAAATLALAVTALAVAYTGQLDDTDPPVVSVSAVVSIAPSTTIAPRPPDTRPSRGVTKPVKVLPPKSHGPGPGACGGDLPPCWVMMRESRGNPRAVNPAGCGGRGCGGKWQFDPRTWLDCWARSCAGRSYQGHARAELAPESAQDDRAREVWADGRGCGNWAAC